MLAHVPHSSTHIPPDIRPSIALDDDQLTQELLLVTDLHTDELFTAAAEAGGSMFINRLSRLVFDPERFRSDTDEAMSAQGVGAVYTASALGPPLRDSLTDDEREAILTRFYDPYARAMTEATQRMRDRSGDCFILDCHSFPRLPVRWAQDQSGDRPSICLGTDKSHTPREVVETARKIFDEAGLQVYENKPYRGCYVPLEVYGDPQVKAMMIEVRRDLYMDEATGEKHEGFDELRRVIARVIEAVVSEM